jgi:hypothetical protein
VEMNRLVILRIILLISIVILLGTAVTISRDYQDSWILEGLEIPFLLFIVTFALTFFSEKKESWLVAMAILGRIVFLLIPNLKYVWFQGLEIDQSQQYSLASYVVATGRISTNPLFTPYTVAPLFHILLSIFSIVLNVPLANSMKYVPILFSPMYPLLTYAIVKKMGFLQKNNILKYALFLSSIPITPGAYVITGTMFGIVLAFILLFLLIAILQKSDRRYWLVCIIFVIALAVAHSLTSIIITGIFLLILALQGVPYFRLKSYLRTPAILTIAIISLAWLMFPAYSTLEIIVHILFINVPTGTTPTSEYIPSTFFQLVRAAPLAAVQTSLVYYGADLFLLILTLAGLVITVRLRKKLNNASSFLTLFLELVFAIMIVGIFIKAGPTRALAFEELLFPIFCGITIFYLGNRRKWVRPLLFISITVLATLELYGCQPLVSPANIIYTGLPANIPIGYVNEVNSVYQRQVISFALSHVVIGTIACDSVTFDQIAGEANYSFISSHVINYYPIDTPKPELEYNLFIIHLPGKAGVLAEKANVRAPSLILQTIYNSSVLYSNGESFILAHRR